MSDWKGRGRFGSDVRSIYSIFRPNLVCFSSAEMLNAFSVGFPIDLLTADFRAKNFRLNRSPPLEHASATEYCQGTPKSGQIYKSQLCIYINFGLFTKWKQSAIEAFPLSANLHRWKGVRHVRPEALINLPRKWKHFITVNNYLSPPPRSSTPTLRPLIHTPLYLNSRPLATWRGGGKSVVSA